MVSFTSEAKHRSTISASEIAFNVIRPLEVAVGYRELLVGDGFGSDIVQPFKFSWVFDLHLGFEPVALFAHRVYLSHITIYLCGNKIGKVRQIPLIAALGLV